MEISPMAPHEWPWLLQRSVATGWAQLTPAQQAVTSPEATAPRVQAMLGQALSRPGGVALVARTEGAPLGYLVIAVLPDELTGEPFGLFVDIWVEPEARRRGLGRQLTAAGEAHCRTLGIRRVRRVVSAGNAPSLAHARADGCRVEGYNLVKPI